MFDSENFKQKQDDMEYVKNSALPFSWILVQTGGSKADRCFLVKE